MTPTTDGSASLRASLAEQLQQLRGDAPDALTDAVLDRVAGLVRVRPRSFDDVREADALAGGGRPTPYWASAWPAGSALTRAVTAAEVAVFEGRRVVELGCGLGMPSVAAARAGAQVLATDAAPEAVVYAAHNLALNGLLGDVAVADWNDVAAMGPFDLVLAADVLYLRANHETLIRLLPRMAEEAWIADPGRSGCQEFLAAARAFWHITSTPDPVRSDVKVHRLVRKRPNR